MCILRSSLKSSSTFLLCVCLILLSAGPPLWGMVYHGTEDPALKDDTPPVASMQNDVSIAEMGGPDEGGYYYFDNTDSDLPAFDWIEVSGTGTSTMMTDDDWYYPINLPFNFNFYDGYYDQVSVGSNGTVYFENNYLGLGNTCIPGANSYGVSRFIALYWDDLQPSGADNVYYKLVGSAPDRKLVIQWQHVSHFYLSATRVTAQVQLHEDGDILMLYADPSAEAGIGGTVGIQDSPTRGLQYSCNEAVLTEGLAILFTQHPCDLPDPPEEPQPADGAVDVPVNTLLEWNGGSADDADVNSSTTSTVSTTGEQGIVFQGTEDPALKNDDTATASTITPMSMPSTGGPDAGGYYYFDNNQPGGPVFDWNEISGTGTNLLLSDDSHYYPINMPFYFDFYGANYDQIAVGSNGTVYFEDNYLGLSNICIPGSNVYGVQCFIALYWDDLYPSGSDNVYYKIVGAAPHRKLIVQWQNVRFYSSTARITAQVQLFENGDILMLYADPGADNGASGTVGIQNDPETGLQYLCNQDALSDGLAVLFTRNPGSSVVFDVYLGTDVSQMELAASDLEEPLFNPSLLDYETAYYWQVVAKNECGQTAGPIWSFTTQPCNPPDPPEDPQPADGAVDVPVGTLLEWNGGGSCRDCGLENGGFETGDMEAWTAISNNPEMDWDVHNDSGLFGNSYPNEGDFYIQSYFDGPAGSTCDLYQEASIPACAPHAILTWRERIQWYMDGALPREYVVTIESADGATTKAVLYDKQLSPQMSHDTGYATHRMDLLDILPSLAGQTFRINFHLYVPETYTGPALIDLDGLSLACSAGAQTVTSMTEDLVTAQDTQELMVNGDFEAGTLNGWTLLNDSLLLGTFAINDGSLYPYGIDGPLPPYAGDYSALCHQQGVGTFTIYQEVTLPQEDVVAITLRWADMIRNHISIYEDPVQEYRVQIWDQDNNVLQTVFSTNPGDPQYVDWTERSADLMAYAGQTVRIAFTVQVGLYYFNVHLDNVSIEAEFEEEPPPPPPEVPVIYDLYLGTDPGQMDLVATDLEVPVYAPCLLDFETVYYWQVVVKTEHCGETTGPVWTLVTEPWQPQPEDSATNVPVNSILVWNEVVPYGGGGDCGESCGIQNGHFETGAFGPWVATKSVGDELLSWNVSDGSAGWFGNGHPFDGSFCAQNGFDGSAGLTYNLYQETTIPACAPSAIFTWRERIQWDLFSYGSPTQPREYEVSIQLAGGGEPLAVIYSKDLQPGTIGDTGYVLHSVDLLEALPSIAGQQIRINFRQYIPEDYVGPAQFEVDGISLVCGGAVVQPEVMIADTSSQDVDSIETIEVADSRIQEYQQAAQEAMDARADRIAVSTYTLAEDTQAPTMVSSTATPAIVSNGQIANGDFETGTFEGWTVLDSTSSGIFVINDGTYVPNSLDDPLPPYSGNYSAMSDQTGPGIRTIYQDVALPDDVDSIVLCWADMIRNHNEYFEDPGQEYRVQIWDQDNNVLQTLFSTDPGDPSYTGWTERTSDITTFAGQTVRIAFSEEDSLWYFNVHLDNIRIETGEPEPETNVFYDLYLGTDESQMELVASALEEPYYNPCMFEYGTTYYWQVIVDTDTECGPAVSPVWSFTTEVLQPQPEDGAIDVPVETLLKWNNSSGGCDEPCGLVNGGFESGSFSPWHAVSSVGAQLLPWQVGAGYSGYFEGYPLEGTYCARNGFDGAAGLTYNLYQQTTIPICAPTAILTWSERIQWDIIYGNPTLPREYIVTIQPSGGGAPLLELYTMYLEPNTTGDTGYVTHSLDLLSLLPSLAGQTIRINFYQYIPEQSTGPGLFELDDVSLVCGGQPLSAGPQTVESISFDTAVDESLLTAEYERFRQTLEAQQNAEHDWPAVDEVQAASTASVVAVTADAPSNGQIINGDFETGNMNGWTLFNDTLYEGSFVINDGSYLPWGPDETNPLPPYAGNFSALSNMEGPGVYTIYQDVALPANARSVTLHWADRIRNHYGEFVDDDPLGYNQEFRVQVWNLQNQPLKTLFSTDPGDPAFTAWTERSADLMEYAGQTVRIAFSVDVWLFFFNVHLDNISLEIETGPPDSYPVFYDLYLGTATGDPNNPIGLELIAENLDQTAYDPTPGASESLERGRLYYWQVISKTECGQIVNPIWSFATENTPPVADAGPDRVEFCWIDGQVCLTLDGSGSYDADGNPITYHWEWVQDGQVYTAEGMTPTLCLPAGVHTVTLVVCDWLDCSEPSQIIIDAQPPVEVTVNCTPRSLNCESNGQWIKAHFVLPEEYTVEDVSMVNPFTLEPMGLPSDHVDAFVNDEGLTALDVAFDRDAFCMTEPPVGYLTLMPTGRLTSGHYFYGIDEIRILDNRMEHLIAVAENWLQTDCRKPNWCNDQDINADGVVDLADFALISR